MKIFFTILNVILILILISAISYGGYYLYRVSHYTRITVVFKDADPFPPAMKVFFKGFEIGKVTKVEPNRDYTATHLKIVLYPEDLKLPDNISVVVKNYRDSFDYVNIVLPELASTEFLKNGSVIYGHTSMSVKDLINGHAEAGTLDILIESLVNILDGVDKTVNETSGMVSDLRKTIRAASPNIVSSTKNLSVISRNFSGTSLKINNSVNQKSLDRTMKNLEKTSRNIQSLTRNLDCATRSFPKTMNNVYCITEDVSDITSGVNNTLQKPMGGARLFFGQPISGCCTK